MKCFRMTLKGKWRREFSVCFRPAWTLADVSGVLWLELGLWQREELSEERCWSPCRAHLCSTAVEHPRRTL